jgi:hypothetical protein
LEILQQIVLPGLRLTERDHSRHSKAVSSPTDSAELVDGLKDPQQVEIDPAQVSTARDPFF